jgi:hypothetical protein
MASIENRLARLETAQQAPRREYTDAERAVRYDYLQTQGGPAAEKARALLEKVLGASHDSP